MPIHVFNEGLKCHLLEGLGLLLGGPSLYLSVLNGEVLGFLLLDPQPGWHSFFS